MAIESLGRTVNVIPVAAGVGLSMKNCAGILFVSTLADTFTLTAAPSFAGSYTSPGNIITRKYTNTANNGTAAWVRATQAAANTVVNAGATTTAFWVDAASLPDLATYVKVSVGGSGTVIAIPSDLFVQRAPANLAAVSA